MSSLRYPVAHGLTTPEEGLLTGGRRVAFHSDERRVREADRIAGRGTEHATVPA
ncbi:MAG: hypothetical protein AVDCRST_MAG25-711 [uncultured Rubrobacteraceae bacterium]|uniref:Uncharacterized protein n=1 Tax=uncultured Rubrobacteraceae bacterium TaxID=349277 RepID=A0A6J4QZP7_9ACTN|nr:MAG: hypothetical protein AVDCRST_MAG25-711 [uncultured Rubrobacteraceae bacterium]